MATLTVRNLSEATRRALKKRAAANSRSMEAEVRAILESAVEQAPNFVNDWLKATRDLRGSDLQLPQRTSGREVEIE